MIVLLLFYLLVPAGVLWLCRKVSFFNKIGPILILYAIGIVVGNVPWLPSGISSLQDTLSSAIIPLAIPMLLFNSNFMKLSLRKSMLTLLCGVVAVTVTVVAGFFLFQSHLGPEGPKIGGMLVGVYTGGTPNLAALKLMLGTKDETYILMNTYDIMVSFIYLVFLMSVGITLFRKFLPVEHIQSEEVNAQPAPDPFLGFFRRRSIVQALISLGLSVVIVGVSAGTGLLVNDQYFMVVVILMLTSLGIAASFFAPVRRLERSFDAGMYLVYVFSVVVASMANLSKLDLRNGMYLLLYIAFAIFVSLLIQALLSKIFRIDADTMVISSVALINSPPLVPMIAAAMKNRDVIITGLGVGIVGYAIGNYLGFLIYQLLSVV